MSYHTEFEGRIEVEPPLSTAEVEFLTKFSQTRRMKRKLGPYYVGGTGHLGQGKDSDIIDYNAPPRGQPWLICSWRPTLDGTAIEWDENEGPEKPVEWMRYLIKHFIAPTHICRLPFLTGHICNGTILAQGEDMRDRWQLAVSNNAVQVVELPMATEAEYKECLARQKERYKVEILAHWRPELYK